MTETHAATSEQVESLLAEIADDFRDRLRRGEEPEIEEYARQYPALADVLRQVLPALQILRAAPSNDSGAAHEVSGDLGATHEESGSGILGDFRIRREVGRGGMGVVYEAEQISLGRRVALKVLPFAATMDPRQLTRFHNEAKAAASLRHDHIVHVYGVGCERGVHFFAMEFIEGQTLAEVIAGMASRERQRPEEGTIAYTPVADAPGSPKLDTAPIAALSTERTGPKGREFFRRAAELIADAADALEHAHSIGIVHRDVKPGNLLLNNAGKVYVSDFGLARFGPDVGLTMSGDLLGTLRYMAPEQALARHGLADHRVDVYGLGCTSYELLSGCPAVGGTDKADILRHLAFEEPIALRKLDKAIPAELETIALKCLAKNPIERYGTAGELAADLRRFIEDKPILAKPPGPVDLAARWARRHFGIVVASLVVLLLAVIGLSIGAAIVWHKDQEIQAQYLAKVDETERAERNLRTAREAIRQMLDRLNSDQFAPTRLNRIAELRRAVAAAERLVEEDPENAVSKSLLAHACYWLAPALEKSSGPSAEVEGLYRKAVAIFEGLSSDVPTEPSYRVMAGASSGAWGESLIRQRRYDEAVERLERAVQLADRAAAEQSTELNSAFLAAAARTGLGQALYRTGHTTDAIRAFCEAIARSEKLLQIDRTNLRYEHVMVGASAELAWLLSTCPDLTVRNPMQAVQFAEIASGRVADHAPFRKTLGVAHYRAGNWKKAVTEIEKSIALAKAGDGGSWFFLAMARWRLGDREKARQEFDKAIAWMDKNRPPDEELCRFRSEAEGLLGIKAGHTDPPDAKPGRKP